MSNFLILTLFNVGGHILVFASLYYIRRKDPNFSLQSLAIVQGIILLAGEFLAYYIYQPVAQSLMILGFAIGMSVVVGNWLAKKKIF